MNNKGFMVKDINSIGSRIISSERHNKHSLRSKLLHSYSLLSNHEVEVYKLAL